MMKMSHSIENINKEVGVIKTIGKSGVKQYNKKKFMESTRQLIGFVRRKKSVNLKINQYRLYNLEKRDKKINIKLMNIYI